MANEADFYIKEGDTSPPIRVQLCNDDGSPVSLDTALVRYKASHIGDDVSIDSRAVVSDPSSGYVRYEWESDDTSTAGYYNAVFIVDYDGVSTVSDETLTYTDGTDVYALANDDILVSGHHTITITDDANTAYEYGTDFTVIDDDGDDVRDSIDWSIGGISPADGSEFTVAYEYATTFDRDETYPNNQYVVVKIDESL